MTLHVPRLPFVLDPLIAEAKRRMRRRRSLVAVLIVALAGGGAGVALALRGPAGPHGALGGSRAGQRPAAQHSSPSASTRHYVMAFSQSSRSAESTGRPLDETLAIFRSSRLAATLPGASGVPPLSFVATHMQGRPGALLRGETRRVTTAAGAIYLVPTTHGWVCMQAQRFETCHRGVLRAGISWNFQTATNGVVVVGIAADNVSGVVLRYGKTVRRASLEDNVFVVYRPVSASSSQRVPSVGTLLISYRDRTAKAKVPLS